MRSIECLHEFLVSTSGSVDQRSAVGVGWLAIAIGALSAVLGTSARVQADDCYNIPLGQCGWICEWDPSCEDQDHVRTEQYCHRLDSYGGCTDMNNGSCGC